MKVYNEHSGVEFSAFFESIPGVPTVPPSVHWRLRCLTTDTLLQDWTEIAYEIQSDDAGAVIGVKAAIDIDGSLNVMQDTNNRRETKQLQVVAGKDTAREYSKFHEYAIAYGGSR